jgi:hypothetical protein
MLLLFNRNVVHRYINNNSVTGTNFRMIIIINKFSYLCRILLNPCRQTLGCDLKLGCDRFLPIISFFILHRLSHRSTPCVLNISNCMHRYKSQRRIQRNLFLKKKRSGKLYTLSLLSYTYTE